MRSKKRVELLDLPEPTPAEAAALAAARKFNRMTPEEYLAFLEAFRTHHPAARKTDEPWPEPFEL